MIHLLHLVSADTVLYNFLNHFEASYTKKILVEALQLLGQLWPFLVMGIIASTLVKIYVSKQKMAAFFSKKDPTATILIASVIGVFSPLGSYIIIPMSAALFGIGVPLHIMMALMVSSPLMNPNLFILTAGAMGLKIAIVRVLSAFLLGSIAGYTTLWMEKKHILNPDKVIKNTQQFSLEQFSVKGSEKCITGFLSELYKMGRYVSKYFFLAIILAAIIKIAANPKLIIRLFNSDHILSIILSTGAGIPFYVCGGAAIPVVQQLADLGMSKGAVLAFFISGPVTKISNLVIIQATFKRTILIQYLATGLIGALILGLIYNLF
ncbi:MAG: permease [Bacteroidales bacterium]|nr:permease [Bacteroidales bacterium]